MVIKFYCMIRFQKEVHIAVIKFYVRVNDKRVVHCSDHVPHQWSVTKEKVHTVTMMMMMIIIIIYPLTARVVGAPQMISQPVSYIFPCSPLLSGTWRTLDLSIP